MGPRHRREDLLAGALEAAAADGLSRLTFGRLARRLGVSDRMLVYYFGSRDALVADVLGELGMTLQALLEEALTGTAADHLALARRAWPVLAQPAGDPLLGLYLEASGLAAAGVDPYRRLAGSLVEGWVAWLAAHVDGEPAAARSEAEACLALVDGLLLLRRLAGPEAAERAATLLGVRG